MTPGWKGFPPNTQAQASTTVHWRLGNGRCGPGKGRAGKETDGRTEARPLRTRVWRGEAGAEGASALRGTYPILAALCTPEPSTPGVRSTPSVGTPVSAGTQSPGCPVPAASRPSPAGSPRARGEGQRPVRALRLALSSAALAAAPGAPVPLAEDVVCLPDVRSLRTAGLYPQGDSPSSLGGSGVGGLQG